MSNTKTLALTSDLVERVRAREH